MRSRQSWLSPLSELPWRPARQLRSSARTATRPNTRRRGPRINLPKPAQTRRPLSKSKRSASMRPPVRANGAVQSWRPRIYVHPISDATHPKQSSRPEPMPEPMHVSSAAVEGVTVYDGVGRKIGQVDHLIIEKTTKVLGVVVNVSGFV